jgi:hypothetical protein
VDGIKPPEIPWPVIAKAEAKIARARAAGLTPPEHPCTSGGQRGAALGKEVHARAEVYLTAGADGIEWHDQPGEILQTLVEHLPPAGSVPSSAVEHAFQFRAASTLWRGLIDLFDPTGRITGTPSVWDHKTTRDIAKYCLLPDAAAAELGAPERALSADLQSCLYVLYTYHIRTASRRPLDLTRGPDCNWNYAETAKSRRALPVVQPVGFTAALAVVSAASLVAQECGRYQDSASAPGNTLSCDDYGGCWYRGRHCFKTRRWGRIGALAAKAKR